MGIILPNFVAKSKEMVLGVLKGKPLVTKVAVVAKYGVLPASMVAALFYSPPDYVLPEKPAHSAAPASSP